MNDSKDDALLAKEMIGTDRWLAENGLVSASVENNLVLYGLLASEDVKDVQILLDVAKKTIAYTVVLEDRDAKKYRAFLKRYDKYKNATSLWGKWQQLRLLKYRNINLEANLKRFVKDYMPTFTVSVTITEYKTAPKWLVWLIRRVLKGVSL